jgi:ribosomal protein S18 acetylase RimI-like enzyme
VQDERINMGAMANAMTVLPGQETLLACWRALATFSPGAQVAHTADTEIALFPGWAPLNNAILLEGGDDLDANVEEAATALTELYQRAGVDTWALWIPSRATDFDAPGLTGWVLVRGGIVVAGAWTIVHERDCGIYAVETVTEWRRRGFASALMQHVFADARRHGAETATLQFTPMGRHLYASLGFEAVGRYEEWVPAAASA